MDEKRLLLFAATRTPRAWIAETHDNVLDDRSNVAGKVGENRHRRRLGYCVSGEIGPSPDEPIPNSRL